MIYVAGRYLNALERALSVTATPSADANYPVTALADGRPSSPFRFGTNAAAPKIEVDLSAFATASGSSSVSITVRAGERRRVVCTGGTVSILNTTTGKYLQSGGGSWGTSANVLGGSGGANYQVESRALCLADTVTLTVTYATASGVSDFPRWNTMALIGHSLDPLLTVKAQSDDNSGFSSATDIGTFALLRPNCYVYSGGGVAERYARLFTTGTNTAAAWIGELVVCWLETIVRQPANGIEVAYVWPQVRAATDAGETYALGLGAYPRRVVKLPSKRFGTAEQAEARDEIVMRSRGGQYPALLNVLESESDGLIFGRLDGSYTAQRPFAAVWADEVVVNESPFPVVLA